MGSTHEPSTPPATVTDAGYAAYQTQVNGETRWYYVNNATGESSWALPVNSSSPARAATAPPPRPNSKPASKPAASSVPATGWERRQQAFVKKYYNKSFGGFGPKRYQDDPRYKHF